MKRLRVITIYARPQDLPEEFIARESFFDSCGIEQGEILAVAKTLNEVRLEIPSGLTRLSRNQNDDAHIVETWM